MVNQLVLLYGKTAILAITAALAAAAVVIGTVASPAFAGSRFTIIQKKDQD
jgi:hypothetical protein